jgi:hypothetical protein
MQVSRRQFLRSLFSAVPVVALAPKLIMLPPRGGWPVETNWVSYGPPVGPYAPIDIEGPEYMVADEEFLRIMQEAFAARRGELIASLYDASPVMSQLVRDRLLPT